MNIDRLCKSCDDSPHTLEHHGECDRCGEKELVGFINEIADKIFEEKKDG